MPEINQEIVDNIDKLNVTVKPETKVLGPCERAVSVPPRVIPDKIVSMPVIKKC